MSEEASIAGTASAIGSYARNVPDISGLLNREMDGASSAARRMPTRVNDLDEVHSKLLRKVMEHENGTDAPTITVLRVGREEQPVVVIDGFAPDPDALRVAAIGERFESAAHHYPGIRARVPLTYFQPLGELLADVLEDVFGLRDRVDVLDASFSIVTTPPAELSVRQRLPHCDAFTPGRIALLHYLAPEGGDGTAFFRHRSTGYETVDEHRAPAYFEKLNAELAGDLRPPARYVAEDTALFRRTHLVEARYNRAILYRSFVLHSGAIAADASLSPDPASGRLTVTAFLAAS